MDNCSNLSMCVYDHAISYWHTMTTRQYQTLKDKLNQNAWFWTSDFVTKKTRQGLWVHGHNGTYMLSTRNPPICESPSWIEAKLASFCGSWRRLFRLQKAPEFYQPEKRTKMRRQSGHSGHNFEGAFKNECLWCYFAVRVDIISIP